ncbi:MAG: ABC transporter permease [bacterium]|nr:ABC transporter permease [bacterium]
MRQMQVLVGRNIAIFLKNKTNVLLCFFSIVIVLGLYVIFLRDFIIQSVEGTGLELKYVNEFTDRLMVSGLLIVLNTTTSFGIMQLNVGDTAKGVQRDYLVAPVTRFQLEIGYWISSIVVSFFFTAVTFCGAELYFYSYYGASIHMEVFLKSIGTLFFSSCMNGGLLLCMIKFMKDTTSFSTFGNLYGMICGFLAGTYLPYAMYPEKLKHLLFYFPPMQLTSMIRQICLSMYQEDGKIIGEHLYQAYGVTLVKEGIQVTMRGQWSYLLLALAIVLIVIRIEYREEKRRV